MRWFQSSDQPNDPRIRNRWCGYSPNDLPGKPNRDNDFLWHLCLCPIVVVQIRRKRVSRSKKTFPFLLLAGSWSVRFRLVRATARQFAVRVPLGGEDNRLKLLLLHCLGEHRKFFKLTMYIRWPLLVLKMIIGDNCSCHARATAGTTV